MVLVSLTTVLSFAATAVGHASLSASSPSAGAKLATGPERVTLTFNEPVEVLRAKDVEVVDSTGTPVSTEAVVTPGDARVVEMSLRSGLEDGTYTVRYQVIGADSHVIPGVFVFGVGAGELEEPFLAGAATPGPSETSAWAVSSRLFELVALGGLIGLLAFRWMVWSPAVSRTRGLECEERDAALSWGRDSFWVGFGVLAVVAMVAEGYLLVVQSASALGVGVLTALQDTTGISQVLGNTEFGSLVQLRGGLLFLVFALGAALFIREYGPSGTPRPAQASEGPLASAAIAVLLLAVAGGVAAQGHPRVAPFPLLQIGVQLIHLATVAVWITGLALVVTVVLRVPRIAPDGGPALSANLLARFSKVALAVVAIAVLTGVIRSASELSDPSELWETGYGRSIVYKILLLCPISLIALYNRRIVAALRAVQRPNGATLRLIRRTAGAELGLSAVIVVIASLLVAQVPGGP